LSRDESIAKLSTISGRGSREGQSRGQNLNSQGAENAERRGNTNRKAGGSIKAKLRF
jgi:hypothetical protein